MRFSISLTTGRLYNGHRSLYAKVEIGRRTWWISRWDTARVAIASGANRREQHLWSRGGMTWYCGVRTLEGYL